MASTYAGIDYSLGTANFDTKTGIHYGVISQHDVLQAWADSSEPQYGPPSCPECGNEVEDDGEGNGLCQMHPEPLTFDINDCYGDEPNSYILDDGEYLAEDCLDSDIMILKSPYYTYAQFCSPCVPGAGNLDTSVNPADGGVQSYCFGHDWFEDGQAPYPVFSVATGQLVQPESAA